MTAAAHQIIEAGRVQADMSVYDLWLAYYALGGAAAAPTDLNTYLIGSGASMDYDVLAQAVNERLMDAGGDHPVPYLDELTLG